MSKLNHFGDLKFNTNNGKFIVRSAGFLISSDSVLLHRKDCDDFWAIIGGKVTEYESSIDAVKREFLEELDMEVQVDRLLWIIENFYTLNSVKCHELQFVYLLTSENVPATNDELSDRYGEENDLVLKWFELDNLMSIDCRPKAVFNQDELIPSEIKHLVCFDD